MGLYANSLDGVICDAINRKYNFDIPLSVAKGLKLSNIKTLGNHVTAHLEGARNSGWKGFIEVSWDKIDIGNLFNHVKPRLRTGDVTETNQLVAAITHQLGIPLIASDIISRPIEMVKKGYLYPQAVIDIAPSNLWLYGTIQMDIVSMKPDLSVYVVNKDLEATFNYPTMDTNIALFTYGYDYTEACQTLLTLNQGQVLDLLTAQRVASALKGCDGRPWTASNTSTALNLLGATVIDNINVFDDTVIPAPNVVYERCIRFKPDTTKWPTIASLSNDWCLYIHYDNFGGE